MKKLLVLFLAIALVFSMLAGCGSKEENGENEKQQINTDSVAQETSSQDDEAEIFGVWEIEWGEKDGEHYEDLEHGFYAFKKDGTFIYAFDGVGINVYAFQYELHNGTLTFLEGENISPACNVKVEDQKLTLEFTEKGSEYVSGFERVKTPLKSQFVGKWLYEDHYFNESKQVEFNADGTLQFKPLDSDEFFEGTWMYEDGVITLKYNGTTEYWIAKINGDEMEVPYAYDGGLNDVYTKID